MVIMQMKSRLVHVIWGKREKNEGRITIKATRGIPVAAWKHTASSLCQGNCIQILHEKF